MYRSGLFIFRRDLRIHDNTGLLYAMENAEKVCCVFIFTPEQIIENPYRSDFCLQFMLDSLGDLEEELSKKGGKLWYLFDAPEKAVAKCIDRLEADLVVVNRDYTPYSTHRDRAIEKVCQEKKAQFKSFDDALLYPPELLLKQDKSPYTVFTPFYKNALKMAVAKPVKNLHKNYSHARLEFAKDSSFLETILKERRPAQKGGRQEALKIVKSLSRYRDYETQRDFPWMNATTHLSAHLKFTTVSAREVHEALEDSLGAQSPLARSLYWRDFFSQIALNFPYVFKGAFHKKFDGIEWENSVSNFHRWCEGNTGFPIVDAGMRELNQTGYMHNRVRMVTASFLVKDLHVDWRKGEKYFAQHLIDYDPAVNNGNWQWAASTGCDAQPYFRIFNPWSQQMKFDPDCKYIKKWIPELAEESVETIHKWHEKTRKAVYPLPMVDHSVEAKKALARYKECS